MSEKGDRFRWAAFWFSVVLAIIGGIIGAIGGSWLVVVLALLLLASSAWRLATTRRTRPDR